MDTHGFDKLVYALQVQEEVRGLLTEESERKRNIPASSDVTDSPEQEDLFEGQVFGDENAKALQTLKSIMDEMDSPPIGDAAIPPWASDLPVGINTLPIADNAMVLNATIHPKTDAEDSNASDWCATGNHADYHSLDGLWNSRWQITSHLSARRNEGWHQGTATLKTSGQWVFIKYQDPTNTYFIRARRVGSNRLVGRYLNGEVDEDTTSWVGVVVNNRRIDGFWFSPDHGRWDFRR
jgi:hypothetical protein